MQATQGEERPPSRSGSFADVPLRWIVVAGLVFTAWLLAIAAVPFLRSTIEAPRVRLPLETLAFVAYALVAALTYLKHALTADRRWELISIAFLLAAANQFVFGLVVQTSGLSTSQLGYHWSAGRIVSGTVLVAAAFLSASTARSARRTQSERRRRYALLAGVSLLGLVLLQVAIWGAAGSLPQLVDGTGSASGGTDGVAAAAVLLGIVGTVIFTVAAARFLAASDLPVSTRAWLFGALLVGALSHLLSMLAPTFYTDNVGVGDLLRVAFAVLLIAGLLDDVRTTYVRDRERAAELGVAYEAQRQRVAQLEELERGRGRLVRMLAHELQQPVGAIRTLSVALAKRGGDLDEATRERIVQGLLEQSEQLRDLAQRAPELAEFRVRPESLVAEPEPVLEIVRQVRKTFPHLEGRLSCHVEPEALEERVSVDIARLMQVFHNLLSNAVKFSEGPVELTVAARDDDVVFSVEDRGIGLSRADADSIFEPFVRLPEAEESGAEGSGLGLFISRQIVEAHGGRLEARAREGGGAVFSFAIPRVAEGLTISEPGEPSEPSAATPGSAVAPSETPGVATAHDTVTKERPRA